MKNLLILCLGLCALCACTKKKTIYSMSVTNDSVNSPNVVNVTVLKTSGDGDDNINLSVDGLPGYMVSDISPANGKAPFQARITFSLSQLAPASVSTWKGYTATLNAKSDGGVTRTQDISFSCYPADGGDAFDGKEFFSREQCSPSGSALQIVNASSLGGNHILLNDFYSDMSGDVSLQATVNPKNKTLTIPQTTYGNYTFRGSGYFYATGGDSLECVINFSRSRTGLFDTCSTTLKMHY